MINKMMITLYKEVPFKNRLCFTLDVTADDEQQAKFFTEYAMGQFITYGVTIGTEVFDRQPVLSDGGFAQNYEKPQSPSAHLSRG